MKRRPGILDLVIASTNAAMERSAESVANVMFFGDRTFMLRLPIHGLRLYHRELIDMTPDEIESASVGFHARTWEPLDDEAAPFGVARGLAAWLPAVKP